MRKIVMIFFIVAAFTLLLQPICAVAAITDYAVIQKAYYGKDSRIYIAIRSFKRSNKNSDINYLIVDAQNFKTAIVARLPDTIKQVPKQTLLQTPYARAVKKYNQTADGYENHGIKTSEGENTGLIITADLCPSKKPLEKELFEIIESIQSGRADAAHAPISLAISGTWIKKHSTELEWIKKEISSGMIDVTWINHTLTHPYDPVKSISDNFLLSSNIDIEREILDNEIVMIENGLVPSPFFRFPGLVSDNGLLKLLEKYSLVPIGTDAWFAKHEYPQPGSIILLHANGNEPEGILMFSIFAKKNKDNFKNGSLHLSPLNEAFEK